MNLTKKAEQRKKASEKYILFDSVYVKLETGKNKLMVLEVRRVGVCARQEGMLERDETSDLAPASCQPNNWGSMKVEGCPMSFRLLLLKVPRVLVCQGLS